MKKINFTLLILMVSTILALGILISCANDSATTSSSSSADSASEADYGATLNSAVPPGLKTGVSSSARNLYRSARINIRNAIDCSTTDPAYTSCPYVTQSGGADSATGEILLRLWAMDYNSECTSTLLANGECIAVTSTIDGNESTTNYLAPTFVTDPTSCSTATSVGREVNMGVGPCTFDSMIGSRISDDHYADCKDGTGTAYDISSIIPWYASWGIPQELRFQGFSQYTSQSNDPGAGFYWTINEANGAEDSAQKYFVSIDNDWLYGGIKDLSQNVFFFFGTGSPAYYEGNGDGSEVNLNAYYGDIPQNGVLGNIEIMQYRVQVTNGAFASGENYIERMMINTGHAWYQQWRIEDNDLYNTATAIEAIKDNPTDNRCLAIGNSMAESRYVPFTDCATAFNKANVSALNSDSNFNLKLFPTTQLIGINFSHRIVSSSTGCL